MWGNYDIAPETRGLEIQWANVLRLPHTGREPTSELPPPFDQIQFITGGTIIGALKLAGNLISAVDARIQKKTKTWKLVSRKIFRSRAFAH